MEIKKAIITAAGPKQRTLPLQTLVDRNGEPKTALTILIEEALRAGIEEIGLVIQPGNQAAYAAAAGAHASRIQFIEQTGASGYSQAVYAARSFTAKSSFLLMVSDHLYLSWDPKKGCAQQLVEVAAVESCAVSAVQATHESKLPYYGAIGGKRLAGTAGLYEVDQVLEKPTPTEAEQKLIVPGLRTGHYLCFFGMHVLTPAFMDLLGEEISNPRETGQPPLSAALTRLATGERYLALELRGRRFDIGVKYGLLTAQMALALEGDDRDEVLATLVELLANRQSPAR